MFSYDCFFMESLLSFSKLLNEIILNIFLPEMLGNANSCIHDGIYILVCEWQNTIIGYCFSAVDCGVNFC